MKTIIYASHLLLATLVASLLTTAAFAQTYTLNSTTTSAAVGLTDTTISLNSTGQASGSSFGSLQVGQFLVIDQEVMPVTAVSSTTATVLRRAANRPTTHASGAFVWMAPGYAFQKVNPPSGTCVSTVQGDPWVNIQGPGQSAAVWRCLSSTWVQVTGALTLNGLPQPAAATALTGSAVLTATGGTGGAQSATTGNGGAGGAPSITGGTGGAAGTSSGTGGAGGAVAFAGGVGGGTVTGGAGGAGTLAGGAGAAGSTTAGVGGGSGVTAGVGGANTASGGTGGAGGVGTLTGGAGGVASTGAATGGAGGAVTIAGGAGAGTITGGAGGTATVKGGAGANGSTAGGSGGDAVLQGGAVGTGGTGAAGKAKIKDAADATKVLAIDLSSSTTASTTTLSAVQAANVTEILPAAAGGIPVALNCGSTTTGTATCSPATATGLTKIYAGAATLASNAQVITFPTAFAATTSYQCVANDITTRANVVQMISTSTSTATITNTTGASDIINWICVGQ